MSQDAYQLQIANRALESNIDELKRSVIQLEDRLHREEAENRRLMHLVEDKNEEIESLKAVVYNQKRENVELHEQFQRHMSATSVSIPKSPDAKEMVNRWVQTLVDITPPEEVDRMHQQIEELQMQLEQCQAEIAELDCTRIHQSVDMDDRDSNRGGDSPDPERAISAEPENESFVNSMSSPTRKPPRLQLNIAIPPNVGGDDTVLTARGAGGPTETPRAHIRIPAALTTSRGMVTAREGSVTARRAVNETPRVSQRSMAETPRVVSQTPRVNHADLMKRSYVDPHSTGDAHSATSPYIVGDDTHSPTSRQVPVAILDTTQRDSINLNEGDSEQRDPENYASQQFRRHANSIVLTSTRASPAESHLNLNPNGDSDLAISGGHLFSIEDAGARCPVCALVDQIQTMYTGKRICKEAYYAVGWIPEMCQRWSLEHNVAWTIEERAAVATALTNRTRLSSFTTSTYKGFVNIWRKRPFWRNPWRPAYAVLQGVFLYIFNSNKPSEPVVAVIPVRASFIELVTLSGRTRCLQISSLGCSSCVGASAGDCVETMTISLNSEKELTKWEESLQLMQKTCAHKCSQKFMGEVPALREIAEMLLTLAKQTEKKIEASETQ